MFPSHGGGRATGENSNVSPRPEDGARRGGGGDTSKHLLTQHPSFPSSHHHQCLKNELMYILSDFDLDSSLNTYIMLGHSFGD